MNKIGIYIHIPFCNSKCYYCNFYSKESCSTDVIEAYIDALCKEIISNAEILESHVIDTIYIGGGTPSAIDEKYIEKILNILNLFNHDLSEVTIEVNPESVTEAKLKKYKEIGINRLSIGLQSANDTTLKNIGRRASLTDFKLAYDLANKIGFNNISTDVIIGLPNETINDFENTLNYILSLDNITHISAYSLEVHEESKLDFLLSNGFLKLPSEDDERDMKHLLDKKLEAKGFTRYEISNYAKPNFEAKHNLKYWNGQEYLGFGAASASYIASTRYTNVASIDEYIKRINNNESIREEIEQLDLLDTMKEYIILKLRLKEGINLVEFKLKFKKDLMDYYKPQVDKLLNEGLIIKDKSCIYLSDKGEDLANVVWREFI